MHEKDHAPADHKPAARQGSNTPIGTHSLTGGGTAVGMPPTPADPEVEGSPTLLDEEAGTDEPQKKR